MSTDISENRINELVNLVITKKFQIPMLEKDKRETTKVIKNQQLQEPTKEFKGILTEFIISELVKTADQTSNFLKLVVDTFTKALNIYSELRRLPNESILFLYKGGNVLRLLFHEVTKELPLSVSQTIETFYKDSFKKSDADFSIYIDPRLPNYDIIYEDICNLTFLIENQIRNVFIQNPSYYFEYFRLNDETKKSILNSYLNKLNESGTVKEKKFDFDGKFTGLIFGDIKVGTDEEYVAKEDFVIAFVDRKTKDFSYNTKLNYLHNANLPNQELALLANEQKAIYGNKKSSGMFTSANEITFGTPTYNVFFNLIRTKYAVNAIFDKTDKIEAENITLSDVVQLGGGKKLVKLDGELIDVSIIHKEDSFILHFFEHLHENFSTYTIATGLQFKAPSITYLIEDLEKILFTASEFPWNDSKYAKRIRRLLFMYFLLMLLNFKAGDKQKDDRINYIKNAKTNIFDKIMIDSKDKNNDIKKQLIENFEKLPKEMRKNPFRNLLKNVAKSLLNPNTDQEEFKKYVSVIVENLDEMIKIINLLHTFIESKGTLSEEQLLSAQTISGGGNNGKMFMKYMKYKTKYLNLNKN